MDEAKLLDHANESLRSAGAEDSLVAVGMFYPRGHTGGLFAGGMVGGSAGDMFGNLAGGVGLAAGSLAGAHAVDAASGLPEQTFVGVSASAVYLFDRERASASAPFRLFGVLDRSKLEVKVHQRVNVRILELIDTASGSTVELEGNRIPTTHSGDVFKALSS